MVLSPRTVNHQNVPTRRLPVPHLTEDLQVSLPGYVWPQVRFSADPGGKVFEYEAKVERVVDGDTLWALLKESRDFGFDQVVTVEKRIDLRLFGLDAKHKDTLEGKDAMQMLIDETLRPGLRVQTIKDKREKFGRFLAVLWVGDEVKSVNQRMIEAGLALPWNGKGPHPV